LHGWIDSSHLGANGTKSVRIFLVLEQTFVISTLALYLGAISPYWFSQDDVLTEQGREFLRRIIVPSYAISAILLVRRCGLERIFHFVKLNWRLWILVLYAFVTIAWSSEQTVSFRRCIALLFTIVFAAYLSHRYSLPRFLNVLMFVCGLTIACSAVVIMINPAMGITPADASWRGIFANKNAFGGSVLIMIVLHFGVTYQSIYGRILKCSGIVLLIAFLWFSMSRGPLLALCCVVCAIPAIASLRWNVIARATVLLSLLGLSIIIAMLAYTYDTELLAAIDRDATLTGRTYLWIFVENAIYEQPYFGYGYGAFWESGLSRTISELMDWDVPSAHNGYFELCLNLGLIGLFGFCVSVCSDIYTAALALKRGEVIHGKWTLLFLVAMIVSGLNESVFLEHNNIMTVVYGVTAFSVRGGASDRV
jgi:exopolysaccharide production protein ExoQ